MCIGSAQARRLLWGHLRGVERHQQSCGRRITASTLWCCLLMDCESVIVPRQLWASSLCAASHQFLLLCRLHGYGGFAWDREYDRQKEEERQLMLTAAPQAA